MMLLDNGKLISNNVKIAKTYFSRLKGLMFSKKLEANEALLIINSKESKIDSIIHMFFVFYPIDVIWLDSSKKVVDIKTNAKPFAPFIKPGKPAKYILELPAEKSNLIKIGDKLTFTKDI